MKRIICSSLKGGTGKTCCTVNLGKALKRAGYKVGLLDVDLVAPTLHKALGLTEPPPWDLDSVAANLRPFEVDGLYALTLASHYGESPAVLWDEATLIRAMREVVRDVQWPPLDYLVLDSPPSSSGFMQALYDALVGDVYGTVLVFQPTDIAAADLVRTLDFIKIKRVPIVGLIANMAYCLSPQGENFWPFISPKVELGDVCGESGIPLLGEVPLTPSQDIINLEFDKIAKSVVNANPLVLKDSMLTKLYKRIAKETVKSVMRRF
ncbi:Iron-sulfur cluster carrier protein [subsurface metagenome]